MPGDKPTWEEVSRSSWTGGVGETVTFAQVGALQRIARATELMAKSHADAEAEIKRLTKTNYFWLDKVQKLERKNSALRGHITRLKKKAAQMEASE